MLGTPALQAPHQIHRTHAQPRHLMQLWNSMSSWWPRTVCNLRRFFDGCCSFVFLWACGFSLHGSERHYCFVLSFSKMHRNVVISSLFSTSTLAQVILTRNENRMPHFIGISKLFPLIRESCAAASWTWRKTVHRVDMIRSAFLMQWLVPSRLAVS